MSNSSNRNFSTLSKANKSKSQKVGINNQSALATSVITGLIDDVVEHAKSKMPLSIKSDPELSEEFDFEIEMLEKPETECYLVKSSKDKHYEVRIKNQVQQNDNIKLAHFECTCTDFKFCVMACKHVFAVYQKFYQRPIIYSASNQVEEEPEKVCDVTFDCWVEALKKVWNRHTQED
ncbi:246_t:CDS:2 [Gigaspora margarita]|uniref:246_t:CDS:1 n=1 Tax=Gigaspora margarita TaxID=4874 RepID=A0ABM8W6W2_GIGMA|nr:246_t:CDS:2 [Gigaspora margarita]